MRPSAALVRRSVSTVRRSDDGAKTAYVEPGSPWEDGYIEGFNARLRDELLNGEIFCTLREAQIVIESWRRHYNCASQHPSVYVIEAKRLC
jgi:putative transposase